MKIYVSADMEGISTITSGDFLAQERSEYSRGRLLLTNEVNAVIKGILEHGDHQVIVNDAHGSMRNILIENLDERATLISGSPKKGSMMCGIDDSFDAAIFVGYHPKSGTFGNLSHTINGGLFKSITINGKECGEYGMNAGVAGFYKVPVIMVSGDNYLKAEVHELTPKTTYVTVKEAISYTCAKAKHPNLVYNELSNNAKVALDNYTLVAPLDHGKVNVDVQFKIPVYADIMELIPTVERTDSDTVSFEAENMVEAYKVITTMSNASASIK